MYRTEHHARILGNGNNLGLMSVGERSMSTLRMRRACCSRSPVSLMRCPHWMPAAARLSPAGLPGAGADLTPARLPTPHHLPASLHPAVLTTIMVCAGLAAAAVHPTTLAEWAANPSQLQAILTDSQFPWGQVRARARVWLAAAAACVCTAGPRWCS